MFIYKATKLDRRVTDKIKHIDFNGWIKRSGNHIVLARPSAIDMFFSVYHLIDKNNLTHCQYATKCFPSCVPLDSYTSYKYIITYLTAAGHPFPSGTTWKEPLLTTCDICFCGRCDKDYLKKCTASFFSI